MGSGTAPLQLSSTPRQVLATWHPTPHPQGPPSCTFMFNVIKPLLPETAEGGNACARPNEDARVGGVLGELEAAGTGGDRKRGPSPQTPWAACTCRTGAEELRGWLGVVVLGCVEKTVSSNLIPKSCRLLRLP